MSKIIDCEGVINLVKVLIDENPGNLYSPDDYLSHLRDTYIIA